MVRARCFQALLFDEEHHFAGLAKDGNVRYYVDYLKHHRNGESRIEHALKLCNQSKSVRFCKSDFNDASTPVFQIDLAALALAFQDEVIPVVEHFISNAIVVDETLTLLEKVVRNEAVVTWEVVTFVTKMIPVLPSASPAPRTSRLF